MFSGLSTPVRGGLLAAVLVVAVALAVAVIPNVSGTGGVTPSAEPSVAASIGPSVAPTASEPSASATTVGPVPIHEAAAGPCYEGGAPMGCIAAGTYVLSPTMIPGPVVVTVPEGWFTWEPGPGAMGLLVDSGPDAPGGSGWGPMFSAINQVRRDPCGADTAVFASRDVDTPAEVAAAIATWPGFTVGDPTDITLAGASGVQIDIAADDDGGDCPDPRTWSTPTWIDAYPIVDSSGASEPATLRILGVGSDLLVIRTPATIGPSPYEVDQGVAPDPERHAEHMVEMEAMLDSVRFGGDVAP